MRKMAPLVSIVVSLFNKQDYVVASINSALNQTYENLEVIVVDDGSTDHSLRLVRAIADSRVKVFSFPNGGPSRCKNRGYEHSSGEFVGFLDADDLWADTKVESHVTALNINPTACLAFCLTREIDESNKILYTEPSYTEPIDWYHVMLQRNCLNSGSNAIHRRSSLDQLGAYDVSLPAAADWDLYLRHSRHYPFVLVPEPLVSYRQSHKQFSLDVAAVERSIRQIIAREYSRAPASQLPKRHRQQTLNNMYSYLRAQSIRNLDHRETTHARAIESAMVLAKAQFYSTESNCFPAMRLALRALLPNARR